MFRFCMVQFLDVSGIRVSGFQMFTVQWSELYTSPVFEEIMPNSQMLILSELHIFCTSQIVILIADKIFVI